MRHKILIDVFLRFGLHFRVASLVLFLGPAGGQNWDWDSTFEFWDFGGFLEDLGSELGFGM